MLAPSAPAPTTTAVSEAVTRLYPSAQAGVNWLTPPVSRPVAGSMAMPFGRAKLNVGAALLDHLQAVAARRQVVEDGRPEARLGQGGRALAVDARRRDRILDAHAEVDDVDDALERWPT